MKTEPQVLVLFGASGDLARRKLMPALFSLFRTRSLPSQFAVLGVGRTAHTDDSYRAEIRAALSKQPIATEADLDHFLAQVHYHSMDTSAAESYGGLRMRLDALFIATGIPGNAVFYLSTPPELSGKIPGWLAAHELHRTDGDAFRRIVVEKPFGIDLPSAQALNADLLRSFTEDQIYRIDHYLGKETVQNLLVFRFANEIFDSLWNHRYVDYVEITAAESLGVESRAGYFDNSGIVRDMIQNHLLQILAMVALDPPVSFDAACVRNETLKIFRSLRPFEGEDFQNNAVFGQYVRGRARGVDFPGYREEIGVSTESRTETFAALKVFVDNHRWYNVPFYLRAGKRLPTRVSEVVLHFKKTPHPAFGVHSGAGSEQNKLVLRIQPDEGILLKFGLKEPGAGFQVRPVNMDFHYSDLANVRVPDSYERLLLDCLQGDATLYALGDAVERCWAFIDPIMEYKKEHGRIHGYPAGTWGPLEADAMMSIDKRAWRYPCKNLTDEGDFCEL